MPHGALSTPRAAKRHRLSRVNVGFRGSKWRVLDIAAIADVTRTAGNGVIYPRFLVQFPGHAGEPVTRVVVQV
jgi:hypothetical protein